jgi:kynurenine formamidase
VLSKELIKMLLENKTKIIGIDSHSICKEPFDQYKMFAGHDTLLVEGLVNLDKVDGVEFTFVSVPVMTNAEAFPVTAYGLIKE